MTDYAKHIEVLQGLQRYLNDTLRRSVPGENEVLTAAIDLMLAAESVVEESSWLRAVKAAARADGYAQGRADGYQDGRRDRTADREHQIEQLTAAQAEIERLRAENADMARRLGEWK